MKTERLSQELLDLAAAGIGSEEVCRAFRERAVQGNLTRLVNPLSHVAVYACLIDIAAQQVLLGNHKKSGYWLPNGGHADPKEGLVDIARREVYEETSVRLTRRQIGTPQLLTIVDIDNPPQVCRRHYDVWCFPRVDQTLVHIDEKRMAAEYTEFGWIPLETVQNLHTHPEVIYAIGILKARLENA